MTREEAVAAATAATGAETPAPSRARVAPAPGPAATQAPKEPLTAREIEVLRLLSDGLSTRDIADRLFISHRTVSTHTTNLLGKLGVDTRAAAVAYAHRSGLLRSSPPPPSD